MKKAKLLGFGLCVVMFTASLVSCANGADSSSSDTTPAATPAPAATTPAGGSGGSGSGGNGGGSSGDNQTAINNAAEGASITLSGTDTQLTITRGITVDGGGLSGATVTVSPSVARNVTLRNFTNSNIRVANVSNTNSSINTVNNGVFSSVRSVFGGIFRSENPATTTQPFMGVASGETFKKVGDGAVPLYLENCTINNIEAEGKVALYLEKGANKKSEINEIKLKAGAEDFSFIEFDDNGKEISDKTETPLSDKSKVGNLKIEDNGVSKVNLIGGTFDNVGFGSGVTSGIELKYDKEFESDQLHFSSTTAKDAFLNDTKITNKEDVGIAKHAENSGVYKFRMTKDEFNLYNGKITIVFMTNNQKTNVMSHQGQFTYWTGENQGEGTLETVATFTNPVYAAIQAGHFKLFNFDPASTTGLKVIQGSEFAYGDYAHAAANGHPNWLEPADIVVLTKYRNYNKEAFIIDVGTDTVDIYVNTAAIKKNDLVVCVGQIGSEEPKAEYGTKASEMDLSQYTPYLAANRWIDGFTGGSNSETVTLNGQNAIIAGASDLPYCQSLKFSDNQIMYAIFEMAPAEYPAGLPTEYPTVSVPAGQNNQFTEMINSWN